MQRAIILARQTADLGEIPVGAILVSPDGKIIGEGKNGVEEQADPTAHAEIVAIRQAGRNCRNHRLEGCVLVCTLEPCAMCAGAIAHARLAGVVFGASDPGQGAVVSRAEYLDGPASLRPIWHIGGVCAAECAALLDDFFHSKRQSANHNGARSGTPL